MKPLVSFATRFEASDSKATKRPSELIEGWSLQLSAWASELLTLTRWVVPIHKSRTKAHPVLFVSFSTRFEASDPKATKRPSELIDKRPLKPSAWASELLTLTRSVVPPCRSRTKISGALLVSFSTRFEAIDPKATKRPSKLIEGWSLQLSAWASELLTLTRSVAPVRRSRTKTSEVLLVSFATRSEARDWKATKRPSDLMEGNPLSRFPCLPELLTLTRSVAPVCRSCTKASMKPLVSLATKFEASDSKATKRPSELIEGWSLQMSAWTSELLTLTRVVS